MDVFEHPPSQLRLAEFFLALIQHGMNPQAKVALEAWNLDHDSHDHPLVSKCRGHAFFGGTHRIVKPADAEDVLAGFMQKRPIHRQQQFAGRIQLERNLEGHVVCQGFHRPYRTAEEL